MSEESPAQAMVNFASKMAYDQGFREGQESMRLDAATKLRDHEDGYAARLVEEIPLFKPGEDDK